MRVRLTCQLVAVEQVKVRQRGAVREGIQRPCGSGESKYRQRCQGVQVSDGLGGQGFKLAISRRGARARTFNSIAPLQVEFDESGAFGEWFKRPWGEQWAKGPEVSVNLHWWSRRSALQVGDLQRFHTSKLHRGETSAAVEHPEILAVREDIQRPCGSEQSKYRQRCQGVQVSDGLGGQRFKLAISRPWARARTFKIRATRQLERHEGGAFGERFKRPWGKQWAEGPEVSVNLHWWSRRFAVQKSSVNRDS